MKPLQNIKVLELTQLVAGPYCGKLLADLGAEVIKIEDPKTGDLSRHTGPFVQDIPHPEKSLLFLYLNTNKKSITLDINDHGQLQQLFRLIKSADIIIEDIPPSRLRELNLTYNELKKINPKLVMTSITPFGQTGPYRDYKAYPINTYHAGGLGYLSPQVTKESERRPVKPGSFFSEYAIGLVAAQGTLAALYMQQLTGTGQHVDISKQEAIISLCRVQLARYPNEGVSQSRYDERKGSLGIMKCKDGHVVIIANQSHEFKAFAKLMGNTEWENDERYLDRDYRAQNWDEISKQINTWIRGHYKNELYHQGQDLGCPITPIMSAEDVYMCQQLQSRQFFINIEHPIAGSLKYPGLPYRFSNITLNQMNPAPLLGQHNSTILSEALASEKIKPTEIEMNYKNPIKNIKQNQAILQGIRIADFSWMWAGAHATELLSFLGAEVIRIESMKHIDFTRLFSFTTGQKFDRVDESPVFNDINLGKKSIRLNLSKPKGVEIAKKIVGISDIVMQNMRPGVMEKLGLGHKDLKEIKPDIVYLSSSSRGIHGPERLYGGYAPNFAAWGGISFITGSVNSQPAFLTGEIDLLSAITSAFALLAALIYRKKTGRGSHIDLSSSETINVLLGEVLMDYTVNGRIQIRKGNIDDKMVPHNCYRCKGEDKWISIAVESKREWEALCSAIGNPLLNQDERFKSSANRHKNRETLDNLIDQWTNNFTHYELMELLQQKEIAAVPCFNAEELYYDSHLKQRGCWMKVKHPITGDKMAISPPWKFSATPAYISSPAPMFGQHSEYVLNELLGISKKQMESLIEDEVIY